MCTYFNLQQTLSRQSQEMTDIDSVIRIVGFSLLHLQANRLIVIQWISRKRGAKKTKSTAKMKDEQKEGKTEREINRYWKGEGRAGRTESASERNDWHKTVLPCRPGPITTPLWNRYNDASFSLAFSVQLLCLVMLDQSKAPLFPPPPAALDPDKGQEQRLCVGFLFSFLFQSYISDQNLIFSVVSKLC